MGYPGENVILDGATVSPGKQRKGVVHYDRLIRTQILGSRGSFISFVAEAAF